MPARYERVFDKLLPPSTRRRRVYELGLIGIRTIVNEGWRSFFTKLRLWLRLRRAAPKEDRLRRIGISRQIQCFSKRQQFYDRLNTAKKELEGSVIFYPYSTWGNLTHLDNLLSDVGLLAEDVLISKSINDIGGADGDLAFYCEFLGVEKINFIDHAPTNYNHLMGANRLKDKLCSRVNILDVDLDSATGWENVPQAETSIFLGILYHLQNPVMALSQLSKKSRYLLLSTTVFDELGGRDVSSLNCAYFYKPGECNNDPTNYWCFTDECLKTMIDRAGWRIIAYKRVGYSQRSPLDVQRDGRAVAYLESRPYRQVIS